MKSPDEIDHLIIATKSETAEESLSVLSERRKIILIIHDGRLVY